MCMINDSLMPLSIVFPSPGLDQLTGVNNISAGTRAMTPKPFAVQPDDDATPLTSVRAVRNKRSAAAGTVRDAGLSSASTRG